ncbi:MAG: ammonium transporter [Planctomycetes bacterium]|nr:ammonium transporter [Planctomycetota bacterium]
MLGLVVCFLGRGTLRAEGLSPLAAVQPLFPSAPLLLAESPGLESVAALARHNQVTLNLLWVVLNGFLVFIMLAGFAMVETGLTRAKNVAHTMAMNVMIYSVAVLGFWICGFAFMFGGVGPLATLGGGDILSRECSITLFGKSFGLFGYEGFFLPSQALDAGVLALFLFQVMFLDTAATIPTGALAERWRFLSFVLFGFFMSTFLYPVYGNWVWGEGWLARLGVNFGLGHGQVDFAGSSVVHMVGGFSALAGAYVLGPRLGKYKPDGLPNPLPAHNIPMYMLGTLILAFGWFGFNAGSTREANEQIARIAVNTVLSSAAGAFASMCYMWYWYQKPDPSFLCNGLLAGLVAITASCAFVQPWAAVLIGLSAGLLVVWSALFVERVLGVDDPVGAISVHGTSGLWGLLALGLFADNTYGAGFNGVSGNVAGLFYGQPSQLAAQVIGAAVNLLWVLPLAYGFFWVLGRLVGNRVSAQVELQGLDVPELGALGYILFDPKVPESRVIIHYPAEPRPASVPPNGGKRFDVLIEGAEVTVLTKTWSDLCQIGDRSPPVEFKAVYPYMTTMQGNRFRFRGGDPQAIRTNLEKLFQERITGSPVRARLET